MKELIEKIDNAIDNFILSVDDFLDRLDSDVNNFFGYTSPVLNWFIALSIIAGTLIGVAALAYSTYMVFTLP